MTQRLRRLAAALDEVDPSEFSRALEKELHRRADRLATGIAAYRDHPYCRRPETAQTIWSEGTTRLLDFGQEGALPVLIIPSLVNRAHIFDLLPERSMVRYLAQCGLRPIMLDWGAPGRDERGFDLTAYIAGRLEQALDEIVALAGGAVMVIGYCMGGLMALALAQRRRRDVAKLVLLATPWDFHVPDLPYAHKLGALAAPLAQICAPLGEVPSEMLQTLFAAADPLLAVEKFIRFASVDPKSPAARQFVAAEDWVNDGVPLSLPTAQECLTTWYGDNAPAHGDWRVAGVRVQPALYDRPVLAVIPGRDKIVPPSSADGLVRQLPHANVLRPALGHVGMVIGTGAPQAVWEPVGRFLMGPPQS